MQRLTILTAVEQVASYLRQKILAGHLTGNMPGINPLANELGVNHKTVAAAIRILEQEGLLEAQGPGLQRRIVPVKANTHAPAQKIGIIDYDPADKSEDWFHTLVQALIADKHTLSIASKSLSELMMDPRRVAREVKKYDAKAWVVFSATHEIYQWFSEQAFPTYAVFGSHWDVPIAATSPNKSPSMKSAMHQLITLGHRRISLLCRRNCREPQPTKTMQVYLDEFENAGLRSGDFNMPDWEESSEGLEACLDSLFQYTPPTALILDEVFIFEAVYRYLARKGLRVPEDVSVICLDPSRFFEMCQPTTAHMFWDHHTMRKQVLRWVNQIARGKDSRKKTIIQCKYVSGGTVGPAPKKTL